MIYHFYLKKWKIEKVEKLVGNLHDKTEYIIYIRNLKEALNHRLVFKKSSQSDKFNQNAWLKPYIDMNTDLKKSKKLIWEIFFKLMNNEVSGKTMGNVRKNRYIKLRII